MMRKTGKYLPVVLLLALLFSFGQGIVGVKQAESSTGVALAAETVDVPIYLPMMTKGYPLNGVFGIDLGAISEGNGLNEMKQAGAQWVRRGNYLWPSVEPNKGDRNWSAMSRIENEMITAQSNGLKTILVVQNTPEWARKWSGAACGPVTASEFEAFGDFMYDLVSRLSQYPYNVKYWEISNEPDAGMVDANQVFGCWGDETQPHFGGDYYGEMLKVVYPRIKEADPEAQVLIGGLLMSCDPTNPGTNDCTPSTFLEGILEAGAGNSFDMVSFHTYDYYYPGSGQGTYGNEHWNSRWSTTGPAMSAKVAYIKSLLASYNVPGKPILATEIALLCNESVCDEAFENTKAAHVAQSYVYTLANGLRGGIWYDIFGTWKSNGLLKTDRTPLPAYHAYKFAQSKLGTATYGKEVTAYSNVEVHELNLGDRLLWVLWATDVNSQSVTLPATPIGAWDLLGNALPIQTEISVSNLPVYLEFKK